MDFINSIFVGFFDAIGLLFSITLFLIGFAFLCWWLYLSYFSKNIIQATVIGICAKAKEGSDYNKEYSSMDELQQEAFKVTKTKNNRKQPPKIILLIIPITLVTVLFSTIKISSYIVPTVLSGIKTTGTVVDKETSGSRTSGSRRRHTSRSVVQFIDNKGEIRKATEYISSNKPYPLESIVDVYYLPERPEDAVIGSFYYNMAFPVGLCILSILLGYASFRLLLKFIITPHDKYDGLKGNNSTIYNYYKYSPILRCTIPKYGCIDGRINSSKNYIPVKWEIGRNIKVVLNDTNTGFKENERYILLSIGLSLIITIIPRFVNASNSINIYSVIILTLIILSIAYKLNKNKLLKLIKLREIIIFLLSKQKDFMHRIENTKTTNNWHKLSDNEIEKILNKKYRNFFIGTLPFALLFSVAILTFSYYYATQQKLLEKYMQGASLIDIYTSNKNDTTFLLIILLIATLVFSSAILQTIGLLFKKKPNRQYFV